MLPGRSTFRRHIGDSRSASSRNVSGPVATMTVTASPSVSGSASQRSGRELTLEREEVIERKDIWLSIDSVDIRRSRPPRPSNCALALASSRFFRAAALTSARVTAWPSADCLTCASSLASRSRRALARISSGVSRCRGVPSLGVRPVIKLVAGPSSAKERLRDSLCVLAVIHYEVRRFRWSPQRRTRRSSGRVSRGFSGAISAIKSCIFGDYGEEIMATRLLSRARPLLSRGLCAASAGRHQTPIVDALWKKRAQIGGIVAACG